MHRIELSKSVIERLPVPEKGARYTHDSKVAALAVCVTSNGVRTFYRCGRIKGRPVRMRLGRFGDITVAQARELAADIGLQVASGKNPIVMRRHTRKTLQELWEWYLDNHGKPNKRTWKRDQSRWNQHLKHLGSRQIAELQRADIIELMASVKSEHGPYAANHCLEQLRHMLVFAVDNGWLDANPAAGIKRFPRTTRDRFLSEDELPRFLDAVDSLRYETARDFFRMALFTGARRGNVCSMRWDELRIADALWVVPASKYKGKVDCVIVLPPPAIEILERRKGNGSPWVFPGRGTAGHYSWPKDAWKKILRTAKLTNFRIHDIRHTNASWQVRIGSPLPVIGKSLGQKSLSSTAGYAHSDVSQVRKSVSSAVDAMLATLKKDS